MTQPEAVPAQEEVPNDALNALILAAFTAWLALVLPAVMASPVPNPMAIFNFETFWTRQVDRLLPAFFRLARPGWIRTAQELDVRLPFDPKDPELVDLLAEVRNLWVGLQYRVFREVVKTMADGRDLGESVEQIRQRVDNVLNITGSANWPHRAAVGARTEMNRFEEAGGLAAARRIEIRDRVTILKRWDDSDDSAVRRTHARVDNQLRRLGETFQVGTSALQYPLDPSGSADDVVNCRCRLRYVRRG